MHLKRNEVDPFFEMNEHVMKNGSSTITSIENDHDPSVINQHKNLRKLNSIKKDHNVNSVGLQMYCVF